MEINIVVAPKYARRISQKELRSAASRVLAAESPEADTSLSIVVVGDRAIKDYNRRFHHVNAATDVLSFDSPLREEYLGDVIISYDTAKENARRVGWSVRQELELLVIHGVLHLLGYDDTTPDRREAMWRRQAEILERELL
ncbi:MAG: rRNA maturation RNase YbeY [Anaerolineae bacterium]|nr:rRNA maturation RNase YbeY [Anaerolineae bacterium]